jgi:hypothetical protein
MKILTTSDFRIAIAKQVPDNSMMPGYPLLPSGTHIVAPSLKFFKEWHTSFHNKLQRIGMYSKRAASRRNPCGLFAKEAVNYLNHHVALAGESYVAGMFECRIKIHEGKQILGIPEGPESNEVAHSLCILMIEDEQIFLYEPQDPALSLQPFGFAIRDCDVYDIIL